MMARRAGIVNGCIGMLQITYPGTSILAALYTLLGVYFGSDISAFLSPPVLRAALVVALIVSYGFVINHYRDVDVDSLNNPGRPIPSGRISRHTAAIIALMLVICALTVVLTLNLLLIAIALLNIILSTLYSYYLKNTVLLGNATIAYLNASIVVYGNLVVGIPTHATLILCVLTFLYVLAQEILYTVQDRDGDAQIGLRTAATYLGTASSLYLFRLFALGFVVVALLVWFLGFAPDRYLYTVIPCSILPVIAIVYLVSTPVTDKTIGLARRVLIIVRILSFLPAILLK
jgi:geranylgeranylglycerol-phosphate geranylgeranyltransferase